MLHVLSCNTILLGYVYVCVYTYRYRIAISKSWYRNRPINNEGNSWNNLDSMRLMGLDDEVSASRRLDGRVARSTCDRARDTRPISRPYLANEQADRIGHRRRVKAKNATAAGVSHTRSAILHF